MTEGTMSLHDVETACAGVPGVKSCNVTSDPDADEVLVRVTSHEGEQQDQVLDAVRKALLKMRLVGMTYRVEPADE